MDATGDAGHNRSPEEVSRRYTAYLIVVALAGWSLASYDLNLLVLTIPDIASELDLSGSLVGSALWTLLVTFTTPTTAWIVIAVGLALGQWLTLALRRFPPGQELEEIAT